MRRLVVLTGLLLLAAWFARGTEFVSLLPSVTLPLAPPHQRYASRLERDGLAGSLPGRQWLQAADHALANPNALPLPIRQSLSFASSAPQAWAFEVSVKRGQRVHVTTRATAPAETFVDVFEHDAEATREPDHSTGGLRAVSYEARNDRVIVVRVQPELFRSGWVELRINAVPALRFPVFGTSSRQLQSIFGDPRDAGRRQHEGVDIFAKRGTAVLSATDGVVLRVGESTLGGRVVWIWNPSRGLRFYYAHLHEQLVSTGQLVEAGDPIGTVGNTGNARTTPPHLHFGIYERGRGAIDPFWFIAGDVAATDR